MIHHLVSGIGVHVPNHVEGECKVRELHGQKVLADLAVFQAPKDVTPDVVLLIVVGDRGEVMEAVRVSVVVELIIDTDLLPFPAVVEVVVALDLHPVQDLAILIAALLIAFGPSGQTGTGKNFKEEILHD